MKNRVHIFGASGSGTTTIASAVCARTGYRHFDSDSYFWHTTAEPFTSARPRDECQRLMESDLHGTTKWVLSGSLTGWGDMFIPLFELAVFVCLPPDIRLDRLKKREYERYGDRILPGGERHEAYTDFLAWAAGYDAGTGKGRNRANHEKWLDGLECPVIRLVNHSLEESVEAVLAAMRQNL